LNAPVFAVISPGWAASKFLHSARPPPTQTRFTRSMRSQKPLPPTLFN
jgi:hypothetical protein